MESFKLIQEESFESISKYLNLIYKLTELENPLAFVNIDGKKYMLTKIVNYDTPVDDGYVVVYEDDDNLKAAGLFFEDDVTLINLDGYGYRLRDELVLRENLTNHFKEQFSLNTIIDDDRKCFIYHQNDMLNKRSVDMHYVVGAHKDPNMVIPHLKNRRPTNLTITKQGIIFSHNRNYFYENENYYRYIRVNDDRIRLLSFCKSYGIDEMYDEIELLGFNSNVPRDITDLYQDTDQKIKCLKKVVDTYKKNTK